jgi:aminomethyltransferase
VAVCQYGLSDEREYHAIRHQAGLLDVTPLCKYEVIGPDAAAMLSRLTVRDLRGLPLGRVAYVCWCDDDGYVIDDGTCFRIDETRYRLTSAAPALHWLERQADGFDARIEDVSDALAALALQGPRARDVLRQVAPEVVGLPYFRGAVARFGDVSGWVTRTGYTGDLGYELWVPADAAIAVWDGLVEAGASPVGLDALDVVRIEAGLIMRDVDYHGAPDVEVPALRSTPFEIGLGWMVELDRDPPFVGQAALRRADARPPERRRAFVGLRIDQRAVEALFEQEGLPLTMPHGAWRDAIPIYADGRQIGRATSGAWSPLLKDNLALATVEAGFAKPGTPLFIEQTVDGKRRSVPAKVAPTPFYSPEHKKT